MMGYDDDQDLVDAIALADEQMPTLLPAAYAACIEQEEAEALAQSLEMELQRVNREKERQQAEQREAERLQAEREFEIQEAKRREEESRQADQPPQCYIQVNC